MSSYFLPGMGMPNNNGRIFGFQNHRTNWFTTRRANIFCNRKYS